MQSPTFLPNVTDVTLTEEPARLLNKNFLLLVQARFVSNLGHAATHIAMVYWVMQNTGSATQMGIIAALGALPGVLAAPVGGFLADRFSRKYIMIINDLFRAGVIVILPVMMFGGVPEHLVLYYLYFTSFVMAASGALFLPAAGALMPQLVPKDALNQANSLTQGTTTATQLMGQGVGGILYRLLGPATLFLIDAITYFISALSLFFIREPERAEPANTGKKILASFVDDTKEGIAYCWNEAGLRKILLAALVLNFFAGPTFMLLPLLVDKGLGLPPDWFGYFLASYLAGSLAGMGITGTMNFRGRSRFIGVMVGYGVGGVCFVAIGMALPAFASAAVLFLLGAGLALTNVLTMARVQESVPTEILGRVLAAMSVMAMGIVPIAMVLAGIVVDLMNQNVLPVFLATGVAISAFSMWLGSDENVRDFLSGRSI